MAKSILILQRHSPSARAGQEMLDMILAASQFCEQVSVLFCDAGVLQLAKNTAHMKGVKPYTKAYTAFPLYDLTHCYVEQRALEQHQLEYEVLTLSVVPLNAQEIDHLFKSHDIFIRG
jgi:tRNA 2-thiouridine synthesizing protein C